MDDMNETETVHAVIRKGIIEEVYRLEDEGYNLNMQDSSGYTPLMTAIKYEHKPIAIFLLEAMPTESLQATTYLMKSNVLHVMVGWGCRWVDMWEQIIERDSDLLFKTDINGKMPTDLMIMLKDRSKNHRIMYQSFYRPAVHYAVRMRNLKALKSLRKDRYKLDEQDACGYTPLMMAIALGHRDIAEYLLDNAPTDSLKTTTHAMANVVHIMVWWGRPWVELWERLNKKTLGYGLMDATDLMENLRNYSEKYSKMFNLFTRPDETPGLVVERAENTNDTESGSASTSLQSNALFEEINNLFGDFYRNDANFSGTNSGIAKYLLETKQLYENEISEESDYTLLMEAIKRGHRYVAKYLLEIESQLSLKTTVFYPSSYSNVLHIMVEYGRPWKDIWGDIILREPNLASQTDFKGNIPKVLARLLQDKSESHAEMYRFLMEEDSTGNIYTASMNGNVVEVERLFTEGASLEKQDVGGYTPLMISVIHGHYDLAEFLLKKTLPTESIKCKGSKSGRNILHLMARFGRPWLNVLDSIIGMTPGLRNQGDNSGQTPLDIAEEYKNESERHTKSYEYFASERKKSAFQLVESGSINEFRQLVLQGMNVDCMNEDQNLLTLAIKYKHEEIVRLLQNQMSQRSVSIADKDKNNVMHLMACYGCHWEDIWCFFYFKFPDLFEQKNVDGDTPMTMLEKCKEQSKEHMDLFRYASNLERETLLVTAIEVGHLQEVYRLYQSMDVPEEDIITEGGQTPLMLAILHKQPELAKYFTTAMSLKTLNLSDDDGDNIFHYMVYCNFMMEDIWKSIFAAASLLLFEKNKEGNTPLKCLLQDSDNLCLNHQDLFQFVGKLGKDIESPVYKAVHMGDLPEVKVLYRKGHSLDEQNEVKQTPLMLALVHGHENVARFLMNVVSIPSLQLADMFGRNHLHHMAISGRPWIDIWNKIAAKSPKSLRHSDCIGKVPLDYLKSMQNKGEGHTELYDIIVKRSIPSSVWALDQESVERFIQAVKVKAERSSNVKIMCIGHEGVGKSCLVKQLLGETIDLQTLQSTNLAELFLRRLLLDMVNKTTISGPSAHAIILEKLRLLVEQIQDDTQQLDTENEIYEDSTDLNDTYLTEGMYKEEGASVDKTAQDGASCEKIVEDGATLEKIVQDGASLEKTVQDESAQEKTEKEINLRATQKNPEATTVKTATTSEGNQETNYPNIPQSQYVTSVKFPKPPARKQGIFGKIMSTLRKKKTPSQIQTSAFPSMKIASVEETSSPPKNNLPEEDAYSKVEIKPKQTSVAKGEPGDKKLTGYQKYVIDSVVNTEPRMLHKSKAFVTIYDFGGEEVFYSSHHSLLTSDSIFLLVFDVGMCLRPDDEKEGLERIVFWLKSIATYATDEKETKRGTPPILLIGSHMDILLGTEEEKQEQFNSVLKKVEAIPGMKEIIENHVKGIYPIANLNDSNRDGDIFQTIWAKIVEVAPLQSQWKKLIPGKWLVLEHELLQKKEAGLKVMTIEEVQELDKKQTLPLDDIRDIKLFLKYLHMTGVMLAFDLESDNPIIVLDAQWVIDAFKCLITASKFVEELEDSEKMKWEEYAASGLLRLQLLKVLFRKHPEKRFLHHLKILLPAMERLGLLVKPLPKDENDVVEFFIVPSMLQKTGSDEIQEVLDDPLTIKSSALCIKFKNPFIPQAIWDKFIAACIHRFQPYQMPGKDTFSQFQRGSAAFAINCLWNMIVKCKDNVMKITLFRVPSQQKEASEQVANAYQIRLVLDNILQQILIMNQQGHLKFDYYLHCDFRIRQDDEMVSADDLLSTSTVDCFVTGSQGRQGVSITRQDYDFWFQNVNKEHGKLDIATDVDLKRRPSHAELGRIAKHIYGSHHLLFIELGMADSEIGQIRHANNHLSFRSQMTKIFVTWMNPRDNASLHQIVLAMENVGMDSHAMMVELKGMESHSEALGTEEINMDVLKCGIDTVADFIDESYFNLFLELGIPPHIISKSEMNHRGDVSRMFKDLLNTWFKKEDATPSRLLSAMKECKMNVYDLTQTLKTL